MQKKTQKMSDFWDVLKKCMNCQLVRYLLTNLKLNMIWKQ